MTFKFGYLPVAHLEALSEIHPVFFSRFLDYCKPYQNKQDKYGPEK